MKPLPSAITAELNELHRTYADYNQREPKDDRTMRDAGHPLSHHYHSLRSFFDRLRYACNSSARLFSYANVHERSEYWAPGLTLSWWPQGEAFSDFGHVYPAHSGWHAYIAAAAAADWPAGVEPGLDPGSWYVRTRIDTLHRDLLALRTHGLSVGEEGGRDCAKLSIRLGGPEPAPRQQARILSILRRHHRPWILARRTLDDDAADMASLPLREKKFFLATVSELQVTERAVLVPLIPLSQAGRDLALRTARDLVRLVDQGYPFGHVREWLSKQLNAETLAALDRRYSFASCGTEVAS